MDIDTVINRIKYYAFVEMDWSRNEIAKKAKVPFSSVKKIKTHEWNPTLSTLRALDGLVPSSFSLAQFTVNIQTKKKEEK